MNINILLPAIIAVCYSTPFNIHKCNKGPAYWCTDNETANACGVTEFCNTKFNLGKVSSRSSHQEGRGETSAPPVNVSLYYESLCPGCRALIKSQIFPTYQALKSTGILNINLYPYGNAKEKKVGDKWKFTCQHGKPECRVNILETCALHILSPKQKLPFIHCIEKKPTIDHGKHCAHKLDVKWEPIFNCYNASEGNCLEHQMAVATGELKPRHTYVPWVTVNGVHTEEIQDEVSKNLLQYVCRMYKDKVKPDVCHSNIALQDPGRVELCYNIPSYL